MKQSRAGLRWVATGTWITKHNNHCLGAAAWAISETSQGANGVNVYFHFGPFMDLDTVTWKSEFSSSFEKLFTLFWEPPFINLWPRPCFCSRSASDQCVWGMAQWPHHSNAIIFKWYYLRTSTSIILPESTLVLLLPVAGHTSNAEQRKQNYVTRICFISKYLAM